MKKMCCPVTGVYLPRFLPCVLLGFAFIFVHNFIVHSKILMSTYEQTPDLWRSPEEMQSYFPIMLLTQFLTAFVGALIYTRNHEGKGLGEGVRFGLMLGLLMGVLMSASYAWMPISANLAQAWFIGGLTEGLGLGIVYSTIYRTSCNKSAKCKKCGSDECGCPKGQCEKG